MQSQEAKGNDKAKATAQMGEQSQIDILSGNYILNISRNERLKPHIGFSAALMHAI